MRVLTLALVASCALAGDARASVKLVSSNGQMTQTSDTAWTLSKTGAVNTANSTVTWQATATQGATTSGLLIVNGVLQVQNTGALGATIGNILVNLQTRQGHKWVTASTNIADATSDDAATSANISPTASSEGLGTFTENAASGQLLFMDASTNSLFALVPQQTIAPGATVNLLFSATFDNNVLGLTDGTPTRAEIIVSFGNSQSAGRATSPNIDISGNGVIDADEDWVRSVPSRLGFNVPAQLPSNAAVVLTDSEDDITTTGTVTFSNPIIVLGPTSGTVTVTYSGGTDGGTITNCAHLTGEGQSVSSGGLDFPNVAGLDLEACDTQIIGAQTCTPGTPGCGWQDGQLITYTQTDWGDPAHPAGQLLSAHYNFVYAATGGVLEVGISGAAGFSIVFTSAAAIFGYQPSVGTVGPLNADLVDPTSTSSGAFGGEVVALELNVDFADAGHTLGTTGLRFGDLTLCNFTTFTVLNGMRVRDFVAMANTGLGGGSTPLSVADLHTVSQDLNSSFSAGAVSLFAQQHLVNGACPP